MATSQMNRIVEHLRHTVLSRDGANLSDGQLLDCFIARREESAFEILVRRHGPMVLSVCRRVAGNHHDAEDAFQATFLVLVRKAASIQPRELVGNWLYGVAYQTALKAKTIAARRGAREKQVTQMPEAEAVTQDVWRDLQPLLDQELSRLSDKYRVPIVLCDLEGKTRKEAAQRLGVPEGTINSRLARARTMLAKRLTRHGVTLSAGALSIVLTQNAASASVPATLVCGTVKAAGTFAAGGAVSAKVAILTEGVLKAMLMTKLKSATALLLIMGIMVLSYVVAAGGPRDANDANLAVKLEEKQKGADKKPKTDKELLQGKWKVVSGEKYGEKLSAEDLKAQVSEIVFAGDKLSFAAGDAKMRPFKIDTAKNPKEIDLYRGEGFVPAIYELDGDTLKICFPQADPSDPPGVNIFIDRPKVMSGTGPLRYVIQFERVQEPQTDARLLGSWQVISVKGDTEKTTWPLDAKAEAVAFSKPRQFAGEAQPTSNVIIETKDGRVVVLDYALLMSRKPQGIDLIPMAPWGGKGKETLPGIYQIDGDTLKICLSLPNQERPKDFAIGDKRVLVVLKRLPDVLERQNFAGTWRLISLPNGKKASGKEVEEAIRVKMKWLADEEGRKLKWIPLLEPRMQVLVTYDAEGNWKQQTHGDNGFTFMNCEGTSAIDPAKKPRTIDCVVTHSGNLHVVQNEAEKKGQIKRGIYEFIDDDTYRICFAAPGKDRPTDFSDKAGSGQAIWVLERVPKAQDVSLLGSWPVVSAKGEIKKVGWLADAKTVRFAAPSKISDVEFVSAMVVEGKTGRIYSLYYAAKTSTKPQELNFVPIQENEGAILKGIYQVEGDTLTICVSAPGKDRPKEFEVKAGDNRVLLILKRPPVIREIDLKAFKGKVLTDDVKKPTLLTGIQELAKAFPVKAAQENIAKQVDFETERLLYFDWMGASTDTLTARLDVTKKQIVFQHQIGVTDDPAVTPHRRLYAISKDATWRIETGAPKERLQGRWRSEKFELDGFPHDHVGSILEFKDNDTFSVRYGKAAWAGTFKLDSTAQPKKIDLTVTKVGDGAANTIDTWRGKLWQGIYTFDGSTLKICFGKERPKLFPAQTVIDQELHILKRLDDRSPSADPPAKPN